VGVRFELQEKWAENGQLRQELVQCRAELRRALVSNNIIAATFVNRSNNNIIIIL
jgi:hypothetical protein